MRLRVLRRFDWVGGSAAERGVLDACLTAALLRRQSCLGDDEDPRFLHCARTTLILMDDAGVRDAAVLAGAALVESCEPELAVRGEVLEGLPREARAVAAAVPLPQGAGERLAEALLDAAHEVRLVACAERLDQARHAHMLPAFDGLRWLEETRAIYQPVAARTDAMLALRYERWAGALERRIASG